MANQAARQWESIIGLVSQLSTTSPHGDTTLLGQLGVEVLAVQKSPGAAQSVWKKLLQQQVPRRACTACSRLLRTIQQQVDSAPCNADGFIFSAAVATPATVVYTLLDAAERSLLTPMPASAASGSRGSGRGGNSSSSKLADSLREQVQASQLLDQLPAVVSLALQRLSVGMPTAAITGPLSSDCFAAGNLAQQTLMMMQLVETWFPFTIRHAAGPQCLASTAQLAMLSMQYISRALPGVLNQGQQPSFVWEEWMRCALRVAMTTSQATQLLNNLHLLFDSEGTGDSAGHQESQNSSSHAGGTAAAAADAAGRWMVACLERNVAPDPILQCISLTAILPVVKLVLYSINLNNKGRVTLPLQSDRSTGAASTWPPAVLGSQLPAGLGDFLLQQLGCSREVAVWASSFLDIDKSDDSGHGVDPCAQVDYIRTQMERYAEDVIHTMELKGASAATQRQAAVPFLLAAALLEWLAAADCCAASCGVMCAAISMLVLGTGMLPGAMLLPVREEGYTNPQEVGAAGPAPPTTPAVFSARKVLLNLQQLTADGLGLVLAKRRDVGANTNTAFSAATGSISSSSSNKGVGRSGGGSGVSAGQAGSGSTGSGRDPERAKGWLASACRDLATVLTPMAAALSLGPSYHATAAGTADAAPNGSERICPPNNAGLQLENLVRAELEAAQSSTALFDPFGRAEWQQTHSLCSADALLRGEGDSLCGTLVAQMLQAAAAGELDSPKARQLFGLLCSMNKVNSSFNCLRLQQVPVFHETTFGPLFSDIVGWAAARILGAAVTGLQATAPAAATATADDTLNAAAAAEAVVPKEPGCAGSPLAAPALPPQAVISLLPWLVLLGRWCLVQAYQLPVVEEQQQEQVGSSSSATPTATGCNAPGAGAISSEALIASAVGPFEIDRIVSFLASAGVAQQFTTLGYTTQHTALMQHLQQLPLLLAAPAPGPASPGAAAASTGQADAASQGGAAEVTPAASGNQAVRNLLLSLGRVLTSFAIPHACNNPGCSNVSGPSEAQLVGGRSCVCGGCRVARYCSKGCQSQHWRQHKPVCRALAAASAAAAGVDASSGGA